MVTVDDSEFNRQLFKGCQIENITTRNGSSNQRNGQRAFKEIIITP